MIAITSFIAHLEQFPAADYTENAAATCVPRSGATLRQLRL
jgi:hypothetical protein